MLAVRRISTDRDTCHSVAALIGALYFVRDPSTDCVKIGHSAHPTSRLETLQVGNSSRLELMAVVAADRDIEPLVHDLCSEGRVRGEWFMDRGVITEWLKEMMEGEPFYRWVWDECATDWFGNTVPENSLLVRRALVKK